MIIHASLQTDIAQFYSDWVISRLKAGFLDIPSEKGINRYDFEKNNLSKIYFWSKDPQPLLKKSQELKKIPYDFEIITELSFYDKCYEPKLKTKQRILDDVRKASELFGKDKISICYGPAFTTFNCPLDWHEHQFYFLCERLHDAVNKVYVAYEISSNCLNATNYNIKIIPYNEKLLLNQKFQQIAEDFNLEFALKPELSNLRPEELDIGEINTCPAACVYCIGVKNKRTIKIKNEKHVPSSSLLVGIPDYDTKIKNIILISDKKEEIDSNSLFDF